MPPDRRRAKQKRRGKADRLIATRKAFVAGKHELRCPQCGTRQVKFHSIRDGRDLYLCAHNHAFSTPSQHAPRTSFGSVTRSESGSESDESKRPGVIINEARKEGEDGQQG